MQCCVVSNSCTNSNDKVNTNAVGLEDFVIWLMQIYILLYFVTIYKGPWPDQGPRQNPSQVIKPEQKKTKSNKKAVRKRAVRKKHIHLSFVATWTEEWKWLENNKHQFCFGFFWQSLQRIPIIVSQLWQETTKKLIVHKNSRQISAKSYLFKRFCQGK